MLDPLVLCCYQFRGSNYVRVSLICICYICYVLSCLYIFHVFFSLCSPYLEEIKKSSSTTLAPAYNRQLLEFAFSQKKILLLNKH